MSRLSRANTEASDDGVDEVTVVRAGLIEMRDQALTVAGGMHAAVLLSHAIWWLSKTQEVLADSD